MSVSWFLKPIKFLFKVVFSYRNSLKGNILYSSDSTNL